MAQAARLNLRMQKELKLLLTDPPPGASFPFLSSDSDFSSLSTIHAQIEGPEGTVYAKGVFEVKIQIPERYPFQPPSVTFATPIYHPNIDNGGRICLDILNLPPKGAWQPSLNISTVLTSIGLLLSEPNPDDGLMCEASQEYKYNRQAFDLKARSMTEKYAKVETGGNSCNIQGVQSSYSSVTGIGGSQESRLEINETVSTHKKPCLINWKLSLDSSSSIQSLGNDVEVNEMEAKGKRKEVNNTLDECNLRQAKLCGTRRKLSLESSCQIQERNGHENENLVANQSPAISMDYPGSAMLQHDICSRQKHHLHQTSDPMNGHLSTSSQQPSQFNQKRASINSFPTSDGDNKKLLSESQVLLFQSNSNVSDGASSVSLPVDSNELQPHKDCVKKMGNVSTDATCKRISSVGKKLSLGSKGSSQGQEKDKESVVPIHKVPVSSPQNSYRKSGIGRKLTLGPLRQLQGDNYKNCQLPHPENLSMDGMSLPLSQDHRCNVKQYNPDRDEQQKIEGSPIPEAIVVLDSEDSEEETDGALRLKLLARRARGTGELKHETGIVSNSSIL